MNLAMGEMREWSRDGRYGRREDGRYGRREDVELFMVGRHVAIWRSCGWAAVLAAHLAGSLDDVGSDNRCRWSVEWQSLSAPELSTGCVPLRVHTFGVRGPARALVRGTAVVEHLFPLD